MYVGRDAGRADTTGVEVGMRDADAVTADVSVDALLDTGGD